MATGTWICLFLIHERQLGRMHRLEFGLVVTEKGRCARIALENSKNFRVKLNRASRGTACAVSTLIPQNNF